jgi:hypothetical protein
MVFAPNGELYVGGEHLHAGVVDAPYIAKWNGTDWSALGLGMDDAVTALGIAPNGDLYAAGNFIVAGGFSAPMRWALWANGIWLPGWTGAVNGQVWSFIIESTHIILAGDFSTCSVPGHILIDNIGTARSYPILTITGPGCLRYLINYTTNQVVYFYITLVASEVLTIDLSPGIKTVTSSFRGNMISGVLGGVLTNWYLAPGNNYVGAYVDNAGAAGTYTFTPLYLGID